MFAIMSGHNSINLQATLSSMSSGVGEHPTHIGHHPISCNGQLSYSEDNVFSCEHGSVPPDDVRTNACIVHSIAILFFEILHERDNPRE